MAEVTLKLAEECLSKLTISQIDIKDHYLVRSRERKVSDQWISDCLINNELVGILKQSDDKFRLYYEHPIDPTEYDLIIVVAINIFTNHVTIITTFEQNVNVRVRKHEQK
jgi:hypothetical protein